MNDSYFLRPFALLLMLWCGGALPQLFSDSKQLKVPVFLASSDKAVGGLYHMEFNQKTGNMSTPTLVHPAHHLGFLANHPKLPLIYGACQNQKKQVVLRALDVTSPASPVLVSEILLTMDPAAHLAVHPSGRLIFLAHYGAGGISVVSLKDDGSFQSVTTHQHKGGSNVVPKRQTKPHPHWVGFSPDGKFAFATDLGTDQIHVYQINLEEQTLATIHEIAGIPGGGPRHMKFSNNGEYIYLLNEFTLSVSTFKYDSKTGTAHLTSSTPALSEIELSENPFNSASEILVHPSGKWVYSANRGHDSVSVFKVNDKDGSLTRIQLEPIRGAWPRNIQMDPKGNWLLAAGADSHTLSAFSIHPDKGTLIFKRKGVVHAPKPICILFMP